MVRGMNYLAYMHTISRSCLGERLGAVALGLSLVASGCGGGGSDDTTSSSDTTATATNPTTTTVDPTTGSSTDVSTAPTTTSDPTTGSTGDSTAPTTDPTTGSTGLPDTSTGGETTDATGTSSSSSGGVEVVMGFFVSSDTSMTGDLGGLEGADKRCQDLADAVGAGDRTWHAYLSADKGPDDKPVHARDRIGAGPWYNAALVLLASDLETLHALDGDHELFLDENGGMINGQWMGSPAPNQHDILTGSNKDGTLVPGKTCADWTSDDASLLAQVGHSDGLGPNMNDAEQYRPWNSVHESGGCNDTAPKGGAGKIYCFAID